MNDGEKETVTEIQGETVRDRKREKQAQRRAAMDRRMQCIIANHSYKAM